MRYTVELTPEAENNLAEIWLVSADRHAVTMAETAIHGLLCSDPMGRGTVVAEGLYKLAYDPLVAYYSVDEGRWHVEVDRFLPSR